MEFLNNLFGNSKPPTQTAKFPDGKWLESEKATDMWSPISNFKATASQIIELADLSPFNCDLGTFCILKSTVISTGYIMYWGCLIPKNQNEYLFLYVRRFESSSNEVIEEDDWQKNRVVNDETIGDITKLIAVIRNKANINDYSTMPPYVMILIMGMR